VRDVIGEAGASDIPELVVFNKSDLIDDNDRLLLRGLEPNAVFASARTGEGIEDVLRIIAERIPTPDVPLSLLVPYERGDVVSSLHARAVVDSTDYEEGGTRLHVRVKHADLPQFEEFVD
jgi:GTP-binding protein HflX